ncbi:M14 family zinc carboxypeptidase [Halomonas sp. TA22]|uniref:M14 family zinc carboxypeptidase n=1 Tax=Halomonas sp. TA22 TaxID=2730914 RepID=UPI0020B638C3|nr:M14 family zinc carboxypeptidase [Halomonas sp. TA22]
MDVQQRYDDVRHDVQQRYDDVRDDVATRYEEVRESLQARHDRIVEEFNLRYDAFRSDLKARHEDFKSDAAEPYGLNFWLTRLAADEVEPRELLHILAAFKEYERYLEQLDSNETIEDIHLRLFARSIDPEDREYWAGRLEGGESTFRIIQGMLNAADERDTEAHLALREIATFYYEQVGLKNYDPEQLLFQQGLRSNDELYVELARLDEAYDTLDLAQAGESLDGNPIYRAVVGNGPQTLMIVTQQHGDEPTATEAALYLLELISADTPMAQALRDEVTLVVMPRVNPDGVDRWEALIAVEADPDDTVIPRRNSADIDLNRAYDPDAPLDPELVPEFLAVQQVLNTFRPDLFLDYHNQNNYLNAEGELETISIMWPTHPDVDPAVTAVAQQAALAVAAATDKFAYSNLSLYPGGETPAIARNGLALQDTPILLVEQRGLEEMQLAAFEGLDYDYSAVSSALILESVISMLGVITAMADGSLAAYDPEDAWLIAERGQRIAYEEIYAQVEFDLNEAEEMGLFTDTAELAFSDAAVAMEPPLTGEAELVGLDTVTTTWDVAA